MKEEHEEFDVKYMRDLKEYADTYFYALINEIYTGVAINLGMSEKDAYKLAKTRPGTLQKAGFFKSIFDKFKTVFKHKVPKFRYNKKKLYGDGKPLTPEQWENFSSAIDDYWKKHANIVTEDIAVKAHELGKQTTKFRTQKKPYQNKSLNQIDFEQYDGKMPDNLADAYKKYDFSNSEKNVLNKQYSNIAMYVTQTNNDLQEAIRQQITQGLDNDKTPIEIASDLYWNVEKGLTNKYSAETLRKNWSRIAITECAAIYEAGILAPYESQAMESIKDSKKAVYFVRQGGMCDWCKPRQGTLVRLIPASIADSSTESLKEIGINDPNTDIYIFPGKNNIGRKKDDWFIAFPAHPHNTATAAPIDIETEYYNPKSGNVEKKQKKDKYIPQKIEATYKSPEEKEYRKPTFVGNNLVRFNNNVYEAVSPEGYNKKYEAWRKDSSKPIPVDKNSTDYRQIFGEAEKNNG